MLILTNSGTDKLQLTTGQAVAVDVHVSWVDDIVGTSVTPGRTNTAISTAATTDIVATPSASTQRVVKHVNVRNTDTAATVDITILYNANGTTYTLFKASLEPNEVLEYQEGIGWYVVSVSTATFGTISEWPNIPRSTVSTAMTAAHFATAATRTTATAIVFPIAMDANLTANAMRLPVYMSYTSATTTAHWSFTVAHSMGIYTKTGNSLSMLSSFSNRQYITYSSAAASTNASVTWSMSYGSGTALSSSLSTSSNNAGNTSVWTLVSSIKLHPYASGAFAMTPGEYYGVWAFSTSTAGANLASITGIVVDANVSATAQEIGKNQASTTGMLPLLGAVSMTQTDTGMPVSFATTDFTTASNNASWVNRMPVLNMLSVPS